MRFTNPLWLLIGHCLSQVKRQETIVEIISHCGYPGDVGEFSKAISITTQRDLVAPQTEQEFIMSQGVPRLET